MTRILKILSALLVLGVATAAEAQTYDQKLRGLAFSAALAGVAEENCIGARANNALLRAELDARGIKNEDAALLEGYGLQSVHRVNAMLKKQGNEKFCASVKATAGRIVTWR